MAMDQAAAEIPPPRRMKGLGVSLEDRFSSLRYKTSGFDYLRVLFACLVLVWHSYGIVNGRPAIERALANPVIGTFVHSILPMFFALSGFLVAASLVRTGRLGTFLVFRGLRIFPALTVEILLSALLLGPILTTLSPGAYFSGAAFRTYFLNIFGLVHYFLPGVFENNPYPRVVNGSLWTVPYELECYFYLSILMLLGVLRRRWLLPVCLALVIFLGFVLGASGTSARGILVLVKDALVPSYDVNTNLQQAADSKIAPSAMLVPGFLAGAAIHAWRRSIPWNPVIAGLSVIATVLLMRPGLYVLAPLPLAYLTVWLGLLDPRKLPWVFDGDYSYGLYLYAFPIQQTVMLTGWGRENVAVHAAISLVFVSMFAVLSWHMIEKPALALKRHFLRPSVKPVAGGSERTDVGQPPVLVRAAEPVKARRSSAS